MIKEFKKYKRKQIAEIREVTVEDILFMSKDMSQSTVSYPISISDFDKENGSPRIGDMIARNPKDHNDQWLIAEQYFKENFEELY